MSDNENTGSPTDRSKRPRFEDEDWDSDYEREGHEDRHPKRQAVPDPETKAPHFVPTDDKEAVFEKKGGKRKKWEEYEHNEDSDDEIQVLLDDKFSNNYTADIKADPVQHKPGSIPESTEGNISIRSLVGTKDAGVIIGRGGKNVSEIRELSAARVTISEIVQGAYERILTVTGPVIAVAKAYALVGEKILTEHNQQEEGSTSEQIISIKLLVPDSKMGTLIGKGGCVIKSVQDSSGARLNASEEPLPMSTERYITIQGSPLAIQLAVQRIAEILVEHSDRSGPPIIQYKPTPQIHMNAIRGTANNMGGMGMGMNNMNGNYMNMRNNNSPNAMGYSGMMPMGGMPMANASQFYYQTNPAAAAAAAGGYGNIPTTRQTDYAMTGMTSMGGLVSSSQAQQIFIPNEMVGCIIGKGGSKINEIRQLSGSHIKIADLHGDSNERLVTITGTPESNQMAIYLLYSRLESEKTRLGMR
ncbi:hypothetical protein BDB01DRAFT_848123 [Pilobolus umbonatus]|nr:hypothetical protein BDB01DRAFT_848123 [Pilobolus umbonatus]